MHGRPRINVCNVWLSIHYLYFVYAHKICVRTHVNIARQWKSTFNASRVLNGSPIALPTATCRLSFHFIARQPRVRPSLIPTGIRGRRYITASSSWDRYHAAWRARLHQRVTGRYRGGWSARRNNRRQYIQFDLRRPFRVVKVVTQGRYDARQWVATFVISYSQDKYRWIRYKHYGRVKVMLVLRYIFFPPLK